MPRKNKKNSKHNLAKSLIAQDDDDVVSIASDVTDSTNQNSDDETVVGDLEDELLKFESKIGEAMDLATEKSAATRTNALTAIKTAFEKKLVTSFLTCNHQTLTDLIERSLKKGKPAEQVAAAKLLSVFMIQILETDFGDMVYASLYQILKSLVNDPAAHPTVRVEACRAFAILAFVGCPEPSELPASLNILHKVFCAALPKGNGELPNNSAAVTAIHAAALEGVCLLMTLVPDSHIYTMASDMLDEFFPVLMSSDLSLRIRVGEAIALVYESSRMHLPEFRWKKQSMLIDTLEEFVNESHKYKAKKDRASQRTSFREIYQAIRYRELVTQSYSVGPMFGPDKERQKVYLESWALRAQYESLRYALDKGLDMHMTYNTEVRRLFELGPPLDPSDVKNSILRRGKRFNRQSPETKRKILLRNKSRDNRAAARDFYD